MEGFVRLRMRPWVRRMLTRSIAIVPALLVLALAGNYSPEDRHEIATAVAVPLGGRTPLDATTLTAAAQQTWKIDPVDRRLLGLLVFSQVTLSFQLPFAIIPLVQFTSDRRRMGNFASAPLIQALAWTCAVVVVALNVVLIALQMQDWAKDVGEAEMSPWWIYGTVGPLACLLGVFLGWVTLYPRLKRREEEEPVAPLLPALPDVRYRLIGVAVEFAPADEAPLAQAAALARRDQASLLLIHVVEGTGADMYGAETADRESQQDREAMAGLVGHLREAGLSAEGVLGYGRPPDELERLARERRLDLLVVGTHGHRLVGDLVLGQTVAPLLHRLSIPVLVVPGTPVTG
jgi:manganese transport protein